MSKPVSGNIHPGPGFRVGASVEQLPAELVDRFRAFETPDISDQLNRLYAVDPAIHCLTGPDHSLCGPVITVNVFPGDNLLVHKVLDIARPGDVVVINGHGPGTNAVLGDTICTKAQHRGIQGFIVDGMARDLTGIRKLDYPVYARGTTPVGPLHRGPGEINYPIACGGVVVNTGDLIVADNSGIVVIPRGIAMELSGRLQAQREEQAAYLESVERGVFSNAWVDEILDGLDCPRAVETE